MFFLLRIAFWLTLVLVLIAGGTRMSSNTPAIEPGEAMTAAVATASDVSGFCERQPGACEVGGKAAIAFGQRAQAGAKVLFDYLSEMIAAPAPDAKAPPKAPVKARSPGDPKPAGQKAMPPKDPRGPA